MTRLRADGGSVTPGDGKAGGLQGWWAASYAVLWFLVIALAVVVVALAKQIGTLHLRLGPRGALEIDGEGPALGDTLPVFTTIDMDGSPLSIGGPGRSQMLLFVTPGCSTCEQVLPGIAAASSGNGLQPFVLTDVDAEETRLVYGAKKVKAPLVPALDIAAQLDVPGTPFLVITDERGVVRAKGTVNNLEQMEGLIDTARSRSEATTDA